MKHAVAENARLTTVLDGVHRLADDAAEARGRLEQKLSRLQNTAHDIIDKLCHSFVPGDEGVALAGVMKQVIFNYAEGRELTEGGQQSFRDSLDQAARAGIQTVMNEAVEWHCRNPGTNWLDALCITLNAHWNGSGELVHATLFDELQSEVQQTDTCVHQEVPPAAGAALSASAIPSRIGAGLQFFFF